MKWFHRHKFDPAKWRLVSRVETCYTPRPFDDMLGMPQSTKSVAKGAQMVYSNTCTVCGDLVFRRVREIDL